MSEHDKLIERGRLADWAAEYGAAVICGTHMEEYSREPQGERWCFRCRERHEFWWVAMAPAGFSYYGPTARMEGIKDGCSDLFPGRYRQVEEA